MSKKQFSLMLSFAIIFAFGGGLVSSLLISGEPLYAQREPNVVIASEFQLVDIRNVIKARLFAGSNVTVLHLFDKSGKIAKIEFGVADDGSAWTSLLDSQNQLFHSIDPIAPTPMPRLSIGRVPRAPGFYEDKAEGVTDKDLEVLWYQVVYNTDKLDEIIDKLSQ